MQEDVRAVRILADRLRREVDVHPARKRVGDHERRRREVVRLYLGVDADLEVAVAREHRATTRLPVSTASEIGSGSGPEFPMQVVQP